MSQVTARLPDEMVEALDAAARGLKRSRAEVIRQAVQRYVEDFDDLSVAIDRLRDPSDPVLDWNDVKRGFLRPVKGSAAKELARIAKPARARIVEAIDGLAENLLAGTALKGELWGMRRIRVGEHRIVYEIQEGALVVLVIRAHAAIGLPAPRGADSGHILPISVE